MIIIKQMVLSAIRLIVISIIVISALSKISLSHVNFKTTIELSQDVGKMVMYDASQKGEILAVALEKGLKVYKLMSLDDYRLIGEFETQGINKISVGDLILSGKGFDAEETALLMVGFADRVELYKVQVQRQKILFVHTIETGPVLNVLANRHKIRYLAVQTRTELQFYHIDRLVKEQSYTYGGISTKSKQCILTSNRAKSEIILVVEGRIVRAKFDALTQMLAVSQDAANNKMNIVDVSVSHEGKEMYVASTGIFKTVYRKWVEKIAQYTKKHKDSQESTQENILMEVDRKIKGITIDKLGIYLAYLHESSLNLGSLSKNQIQHIKSYDLSRLCQPFSQPFTHIQYIYEERLVIPCTKDTKTKLLIVHTCQAEGCTNFCGPPCGDCFVDTESGEECDDCNWVGGDGCSALCLIQKPMNLNVIYIEKLDTANELEIKIQMETTAVVDWGAILLDNAVNIVYPPGLVVSSTIENLNNGYFLIHIIYTADMQDQKINITLALADVGLTRFPTKSLSVTIVPYDNEVAYVYDDATYLAANAVKGIAITAFVIGFLFFLISIAAGKIIGIEMMAVIQISYLSLISLTSLNPALNLVSELYFVNGYNNLYYNKEFLSQPELTKVRGITLFPHFIENYSFTMVLVFIPLLLALIAFLMTKFCNKDWEMKWKRLLGEYTFNGLMFSGYIVGVALALQFLYGFKNNSGPIGGFSILFSILFLGLYIGYMVLFIFKPEFFGEFTSFFKQNSIDRKFYLLLVPERLIVGMLLVFMLASKLSFLLVICVYAAFGVIVVLRRPYMKTHHNIRYILNVVIVIVIQIIYLGYNQQTMESQNKSSLYNKALPLIVVILLLVCVLYSAAAIIWEIICMYRGEKEQAEQEEKESSKNENNKEDEKEKSVKSSKSKPKSKKAKNDVLKEIEETKREMLMEGHTVREAQAEKRPIQPEYMEGEKYEVAHKIKKQLMQDFGISNYKSREGQSNRQQQVIIPEAGEHNFEQAM